MFSLFELCSDNLVYTRYIFSVHKNIEGNTLYSSTCIQQQYMRIKYSTYRVYCSMYTVVLKNSLYHGTLLEYSTVRTVVRTQYTAEYIYTEYSTLGCIQQYVPYFPGARTAGSEKWYKIVDFTRFLFYHKK